MEVSIKMGIITYKIYASKIKNVSDIDQCYFEWHNRKSDAHSVINLLANKNRQKTMLTKKGMRIIEMLPFTANMKTFTRVLLLKLMKY